MKETFLEELEIGKDVQSFFMIKNFGVKIGANKKQYLDVTLCDKTGDVSGKQWDITEEDLSIFKTISDGDIIKIRGSVTEWNGAKQVRISKIRKSMSNDNLVMTDYVKAAPEKPEDMYDFIMEKIMAMQDKELQALCHKMITDNRDKLMYYPAAAKNHHAIMSGLLYHIKRMLESGLALCQVYTNLNKDLLTAGIILHDIEKLTEIESNQYGMASGYSFEGQMLGHLVQGVKVIDRIGRELGMGEEKMIMLEHMLISHHYEPEYGSPKKPLFPEAEMLHYLDMIDAKMYDMIEALSSTEHGYFSERVFTLDGRRIYKPID